jgi:RNA polymerase sigma-70 factor, ECF subfamily
MGMRVENEGVSSSVNGQTWQAEQFELQRSQLQAVAYRMLGSVAEAEDAVQETWMRLSRSADPAIANMGGWLTTVVGRVCIDMLRARQTRRETYVGTWLPEPVVTVDGPGGADRPHGPEQEAVLSDSVGLAMLVVLDTLSPPERLAFVLHDMFGLPFTEIAPILDRTPAATRQLASRARRTIRGAPTTPDPDLGRQRKVVAAFLAAARAGDFDALISVLHPDVVFRADTGGRAHMAPALVSGAANVARHAAEHGPRFAKLCRPALVNGSAGIVARAPAGLLAVAGMTVIDGKVAAVDIILDPDKLALLSVDPDI